MEEIIEDKANENFPNSPMAPSMKMTINNETLNIGGSFDTPSLSGAIYHQSTFNDLFVKGLSATVGLRLDYEKTSMKYRSISEPIDFDFSISMLRPLLNL